MKFGKQFKWLDKILQTWRFKDDPACLYLYHLVYIVTISGCWSNYRGKLWLVFLWLCIGYIFLSLLKYFWHCVLQYNPFNFQAKLTRALRALIILVINCWSISSRKWKVAFKIEPWQYCSFQQDEYFMVITQQQSQT